MPAFVSPPGRPERLTSPQILAQLSGLQGMMRDLLRSVPEADANALFHPKIASLSWYLGRSVFRETYWLREVLAGDADLAGRVRPLFTPGGMDLQAQCARLPPPEHLLRWAAEIQDEHLRRLATPGDLRESPLLAKDRLQWFLLQESARDYERMLVVLLARRLAQQDPGHQVQERLAPSIPWPDRVEVEQGHYRIGSREEPFAYDNELPPQAIELSGFRIARRPVSNAEYLAFMEAGGYRNHALWSEEGGKWREATGTTTPLHWRRDEAGHWYGIGLNGPADLQPGEPVSGIGRHEAQAFATWTASLGGEWDGAVLQHEYQWEVAARSGQTAGTGRVWEWCANPIHPYPQFEPFPDAQVSQRFFGNDNFSLRGASLHTQRCVRRSSYRSWAPATDRHRTTGTRLVFPPA